VHGVRNVLPSEPTNPQNSSRSLDGHLLRGVGWTAVSKWSAQVVSWGSMLVLARLLTPADFGLVGMASVFLGLVTMVSEFGLGSAVVTMRELPEHEIRQLHTCSALFGLGAWLLAVAAALPVAFFFGTPALAPILAVASLSFLPGGVRTVPGAMLQREMGFKLISFAEAMQSIIQACGAMVLAWVGFGYWSLVWPAVVGSVVYAGLLWRWSPQSFVRPRWRTVRPALVFGSHLLVSRLSWYLYSNADFAVAGKTQGASQLGAYNLAWSLASMPVDKISDIVTRVTPSIFSAVRNSDEETRRYLTGITGPLAFVTFPAAFGLAVVAPDALNTLLGPKWAPAMMPLRLLACYASLRSISTVLPHILVARKDTRFGMWSALFSLSVLIPAFVIGSRWGITGIAWAWVVAYPVVAFPLYWRTFRLIHLNPVDYLRALWPTALASGVMVISALAAKSLLPDAPSPLRLAAEVLAGAAAYLGVYLLFFRDRLERYRRLARSGGA
jgi:O-antigen/teichoic acid export membrane protein